MASQKDLVKDISRQSINTPLLILIINKLYRHDETETWRQSMYSKNGLYFKSQVKIQAYLSQYLLDSSSQKYLRKAHCVSQEMEVKGKPTTN